MEMAALCLLLGHRRSAKEAWRTTELAGWKSKCRHCGEMMVRVAPSKWILQAEVKELKSS